MPAPTSKRAYPRRSSTPTTPDGEDFTMTLFFTDIDGTLLNPDRTLSLRTIHAIREVRAAGHRFVLCSSRMPESMRKLERLYDGMDEPLIAYNGGLVLSRTGEIVHDVPIHAQHARLIAKYCREVDLHASFFAGENWYAWTDDKWTCLLYTSPSPRD